MNSLFTYFIGALSSLVLSSFVNTGREGIGIARQSVDTTEIYIVTPLWGGTTPEKYSISVNDRISICWKAILLRKRLKDGSLYFKGQPMDRKKKWTDYGIMTSGNTIEFYYADGDRKD